MFVLRSRPYRCTRASLSLARLTHCIGAAVPVPVRLVLGGQTDRQTFLMGIRRVGRPGRRKSGREWRRSETADLLCISWVLLGEERRSEGSQGDGDGAFSFIGRSNCASSVRLKNCPENEYLVLTGTFCSPLFHQITGEEERFGAEVAGRLTALAEPLSSWGGKRRCLWSRIELNAPECRFVVGESKQAGSGLVLAGSIFFNK